jgi:hypothetical protein
MRVQDKQWTMHYFCLEVWQSPSEVFLGQGEYAVKILK